MFLWWDLFEKSDEYLNDPALVRIEEDEEGEESTGDVGDDGGAEIELSREAKIASHITRALRIPQYLVFFLGFTYCTAIFSSLMG